LGAVPISLKSECAFNFFQYQLTRTHPFRKVHSF